jgi:transcriptional regulator with GAF, ATPase, and Fis domain
VNAVERDGIIEALRACGGNRTNAARRLGLKRTTLLSAMRRLGIE